MAEGLCHLCEDNLSGCESMDSECCDCGKGWCSPACAMAEGLLVEEDRYGEDGYTCNFCRMENAEDWELVDFLLKKANLTREQAVKMYYTEYLPYEGN